MMTFVGKHIDEMTTDHFLEAGLVDSLLRATLRGDTRHARYLAHELAWLRDSRLTSDEIHAKFATPSYPNTTK